METWQEKLTDGSGLSHNYVQGHEHVPQRQGRLVSQRGFTHRQVCPLSGAQKSNAPAQFLLGQGVSFPFSSPSTHTHKMCKFHIPCSKGSSSTQSSDGEGCELETGISTTEKRDGTSGPFCFLLLLEPWHWLLPLSLWIFCGLYSCSEDGAI